MRLRPDLPEEPAPVGSQAHVRRGRPCVRRRAAGHPHGRRLRSRQLPDQSGRAGRRGLAPGGGRLHRRAGARRGPRAPLCRDPSRLAHGPGRRARSGPRDLSARRGDPAHRRLSDSNRAREHGRRRQRAGPDVRRARGADAARGATGAARHLHRHLPPLRGRLRSPARDRLGGGRRGVFEVRRALAGPGLPPERRAGAPGLGPGPARAHWRRLPGPGRVPMPAQRPSLRARPQGPRDAQGARAGGRPAKSCGEIGVHRF